MDEDTSDSDNAGQHTGATQIGEDVDRIPEDAIDHGNHRPKHEIQVEIGHAASYWRTHQEGGDDRRNQKHADLP